MVLWAAAAIAVVVERPHHAPPRVSPSRRLAMTHGLSATLITLFALVHLTNHLAGLNGGETHVAIMHALRKVYRHPLIEPVLLAAVAFQVASGTVLLWRKIARSTGWVDTLQTASGAYLMMFFLSHVSAALRARYLRGIDTNWAWASGRELLTDPWSARLAPYYFLAVIAFGVHAACGLRLGARRVAIAAGVFAITSSLIFAGLVR
jgi:succinate dehydrogenase/fumarate reductase cytochrome b subunit